MYVKDTMGLYGDDFNTKLVLLFVIQLLFQAYQKESTALTHLKVLSHLTYSVSFWSNQTEKPNKLSLYIFKVIYQK